MKILLSRLPYARAMAHRSLSYQQALSISLRGYHTYPAPDEAAVVSTARSDVKSTTVKTGEDYAAMKRFNMTKAYHIPDDIQPVPFTQEPKTIITNLANGLTIATQDMPGLMCSMCLLVKTGSTAEDQTSSAKDNTGTAQMLELTAFGDTLTRTREDTHASIEQLGGIVQCVAQRESITFFMDVFKNKMNESLDILADSVLNASLTTEEVERCKEDMRFMRDMTPPDFISKDAVVMAAYKNQPLGNHHFCPVDKIDRISREMLIEFKNNYFVPENCIIAASAVDHDVFVHQVERAFSKLGTSATRDGLHLSVPSTKYTGGMVVEERTLRDEFIKCTVGFEVGGWRSDQFVTACVLQMLLGGGSSFSAGGPGKGMYTRLYREILNKYGWVESAEAFIVCHRDAGILGIDGSCQADGVGPIIQVFLDQLLQLSVREVTAIELSRAKNMLKSMMFMQLESRLVTCEDIAKQILVYGERKNTQMLCDQIDRVSPQDIVNLARFMFEHDPAVAIIGHDVSTAPTFEAIKQFTNSYKNDVWSKHAVVN